MYFNLFLSLSLSFSNTPSATTSPPLLANRWRQLQQEENENGFSFRARALCSLPSSVFFFFFLRQPSQRSPRCPLLLFPLSRNSQKKYTSGPPNGLLSRLSLFRCRRFAGLISGVPPGALLLMAGLSFMLSFIFPVFSLSLPSFLVIIFLGFWTSLLVFLQHKKYTQRKRKTPSFFLFKTTCNLCFENHVLFPRHEIHGSQGLEWGKPLIVSKWKSQIKITVRFLLEVWITPLQPFWLALSERIRCGAPTAKTCLFQNPQV